MRLKISCLVLVGVVVSALVAAPPQAVGQISYTWTGTTSNVWDPGSPDLNWVSSGVLSTYSDNSIVTFDDTAAGNTSPIMIAAGGVQPSSVVFNNTLLSYSFSGGGIGGTGSVTLNGGGSVIFNNVNTYSGGTTISGPSLLQLGSGASLGTGALEVDAGTLDIGGNTQAATSLSGLAGIITSSLPGGMLAVSQTTATTFSGTLQDSGGGNIGLSFNGAGGGSLLLSGTNTYSGATTISAGSLAFNGQLTNSSVGVQGGLLLGSGQVNKNVTLSSGGVAGTLAIGGNLTVTGNSTWYAQNTVSGGATVQGGLFTLASGAVLTTPALNVTGGAIAAADGTGTLAGSLNYTSSTSSTFLGGITGAGSTVTMNNALSMLTLSGTNTYGGATTITSGTLQVGGPYALPGGVLGSQWRAFSTWQART